MECDVYYSVQDLQYKVVRVSNKSGLQECFRVLGESVLPECATSVEQDCQARVSHKSAP